MNGNLPAVRKRYANAVRNGSTIATSSIVAHELWYGVAKSDLNERNARKLRGFLSSGVTLQDFSEQDAQIAGQIRAELERRGKRIGEYDTLIAGQALARNLVLVTANTREFERVKGLRLEDWSA
jgi:tRNA(fMet)-specific endonuclease VapC